MAMLLGLVRPTSGARHRARRAARSPRSLPRPGRRARRGSRAVARPHRHREPPGAGPAGRPGRPADPRTCSTWSASPTEPTTASASYSLGMKQRLGLAGALLGDPALLVLDEPTNGLDPVGMSEIRDLLGRLAAEDRTVLVSSHLLSELEQVSDWLLIIDDGGSSTPARRPASPRAPAPRSSLLPLDDERPARPRRRREPSRASWRAGTATSSSCPSTATIPATSRHRSTSAAAAAGIVLAELHVRRPSLEASYFQPPSKEMTDDPHLPRRARQARSPQGAAASPPRSSSSVGVGGAAIVLGAAKPAAETFGGRGPSPSRDSSGAGGGTEVFRDRQRRSPAPSCSWCSSALIAIEFSRGTIRTMLLRQPRRVRLLAGKLAGADRPSPPSRSPAP